MVNIFNHHADISIYEFMNKKIAILIPVFNGLVYLQKYLPSVLSQINKINTWEFKVIIIDDHSTDGTSSWLEANHPGIIVLNGSGSLWWSGCLNMGIRYVLNQQDFKYVLLWNHDTLCENNYFDKLTECLHKYDSTTIIASKIYFLDKPDIIFNMGAFFNSNSGKSAQNGYGMTDSEEFAKPVYVDWAGGMGTLIPIGIFHKIGLFDEKNFPQYYGDCDFCLRAKDNGFKLVVLPELKIWNDKSSSGMEHNGQWKFFLLSLFSIKSNHNIIVRFKFVKRHSKSIRAFFNYTVDIGLHFASFLKHWTLKLYK
jgi:hypothetical protein